MLFEGEIKGAGAADLIREFIEITNTEVEFFPLEDTAIQLKRLTGGVTEIEMSNPRHSVAMSLKDTWNSHISFEYGHAGQITYRSTRALRRESQREYRDFLAIVERACY